jgi:hypothetical protein
MYLHRNLDRQGSECETFHVQIEWSELNDVDSRTHVTSGLMKGCSFPRLSHTAHLLWYPYLTSRNTSHSHTNSIIFSSNASIGHLAARRVRTQHAQPRMGLVEARPTIHSCTAIFSLREKTYLNIVGSPSKSDSLVSPVKAAASNIQFFSLIHCDSTLVAGGNMLTVA